MMPVKPADFSAADPQAFYLPASRADWEALSDATLVVQGARLPVHSQVLSLHSGVLRGLFADFLGGSGGRMDCKCKADSQEEGPEGLVLEQPFSESDLFDAALFLRFCYRPRDLCLASLAAVPDSLPGLLCLAHKLDAPEILQAVSLCITVRVEDAATEQLMEWVAAADACQLESLSLRCTTQLARRLASGVASLPAALAAAALLERLDKGTLLRLLGLLVAAGGGQACDKLASPEAAQQALVDAANPGSFEWVLEGFSQQPAGAGQMLFSPYFAAGGREWRFVVYPGGDTEEAAGHLSVYLQPRTNSLRAVFSLTVVDSASEEPANHTYSSNGVEEVDRQGRGWRKFMPLTELRSRPGYLTGDRLVLRARVEVVA